MDLPSLTSACDKLAACLSEGGFEVAVHGPDGWLCHEERGWTTGAMVPVWSATKGPAAATLLLLLEDAGLDLHDEVRAVWPQFHAKVSFAQVLSHQAGLAAPEGDFSVFEQGPAAESLAVQALNWPPGTAHGYHPRTWGFLMEEISLRLTGERLGVHWQQRVAIPQGVDFFIGLPPEQFGRVIPVKTGRPSARPEEKEFVAAYMQPESLTRRAFDSYRGLNASWEFNHPAAWQLGSPAFGGVGSARGLARFYALFNLGVFSSKLLGWMQTPLVTGQDRILHLPTTFTAGFQQDPLGPDGRKLRQHYGPSPQAFGHPGAGGSIGLTDPSTGRSLGMVLNVISPGIFPRAEILNVVNAAMKT